MAGLTRSGMGVIAAVFNLTLIPVVAFYLMRDWDRLVAGLLDLVPMTWQQDISGMVSEADEVLGEFLRGQFLVMLAQAFLYSAGLWIIGVDFALILGTVAGLASIIPYAGAVLGVGSSLLVAWFQSGGDLMFLVWVGLVFGFGQMVESLFLTPTLIGDRIGLHPVMVIFALMAGGQLAGFAECPAGPAGSGSGPGVLSPRCQLLPKHRNLPERLSRYFTVADQLTLKMRLDSDISLDNFYVRPGTSELTAAVRGAPTGTFPSYFLWGNEGVGKSHFFAGCKPGCRGRCGLPTLVRAAPPPAGGGAGRPAAGQPGRRR